MQAYMDTALFRVHVTAVPSLLAITPKEVHLEVEIMHLNFIDSRIILALPKPNCIFSYPDSLRVELSSHDC